MSETRHSHPNGFWRGFLWGAFFTALLPTSGFLVFMLHPGGAASWLPISDPPAQADYVVLLGGGPLTRPRTAWNLLRQGYARDLLLVGQKREPLEELLPTQCPECRFDPRRMRYLENSLNTISDARITLDHLRGQPVRRLLVVTDAFHSRRVKAIFSYIFRYTGIEVRVVNTGNHFQSTSANKSWRLDSASMALVWEEIGKLFFFKLLHW
ncbi:MAG: YdcF family protein [Magnetococcales bacterium]|nr:YdcF family protein [Magnetococcales bacterium]